MSTVCLLLVVATIPLLALGSSLDIGDQLARLYQPSSDGWTNELDFDNIAEEPKALRDAGGVEPKDMEYLQHSSLWGHQYIQGGAGKGQQFLLPQGSIPSKQQIKTDAVLPAYCDPPNPCPIGYGSDDGCLEQFENTAEFSSEYQGKQDCMCDEEHMFSCPRAKDAAAELLANGEDAPDAELDEFTNRLNSLLEKANINGQHKVVAKKFHAKKKKSETISAQQMRNNPYLDGEQLKVVAKKG